jgi:formate transporter
MAWAEGRIDARELLRNWAVACAANAAGAVVLVALVYWVIYVRPAAATGQE